MMWNGGYGMIGWSGLGWLWPLHVLIPLLILGLIIFAVVAAVRYGGGLGGSRKSRRARLAGA